MKLSIAPEIAKALAANAPVVALESTVIAHGLPRPRNLSTARARFTRLLLTSNEPPALPARIRRK